MNHTETSLPKSTVNARNKKVEKMPPKAKKQKEIVQDEKLQAIVLTDSFQTRFNPLTSVKPRCLLPLANIPLIEYTLEFLAKASVNEVFLICCSHADQIQQYIEKSKWSDNGAPFKISTVNSLESRSVGDSMRDLDNRGLITGDFLLISGDVVTNIDFDKALQFHKQKKSVDKDHIATMVLSQASPFHRTRSQVDPATFILDKLTNRCIYYQDIPPADKPGSFVSIDPELLENVEEFVIRNDLIDCCVDICTPHVPVIFQENFDYQHLRTDFVQGVLTSDLLGKTIYSYITTEYAARAESWQTYNAISQDILARWTYPVVPDSNLLQDQTYSYESKHIYKEDNVVLAQSCKIGYSTMIGSHTTVGDGSVISNSIIGRNCKIGSGVIIQNSYVWDNSTICDGADLSYCIVASDAKISSRAKILPGAVIGFDVVVGVGITIEENTKISATLLDNSSEFDDFDNEDSDSSVSNADIVGEDGRGFIFPEVKTSQLMYKLKSLNLSDDSIVSVTPKGSKKRHTRKTSTATYTDFLSSDSSDSSDGEEDFGSEAIATVTRAMEQNHDIDTALLELNTLRMSMNVTYHEVRHATIAALLERTQHFVNTKTLDLKNASDKIFGQWGLLFKRQIFEPEDEEDLLYLLEKECAKNNEGDKSLFFGLRTLYEIEVISEESIYHWWDAGEENAKVRLLAGRFVDWLKEAEEDSD